MNTKPIVFAAGMLCGLMGYAQEPQQLETVYLTDSKFELNRENSGKVISKITAAQLERMQGKTLAEVINTISGIEISGSRSNAGQNLSYFVRGGNNRQVLIVIDGIQMNDPSQIANDFDLRLLDLNSIDHIEILKGAASTLYGSGAATAVISITTKKASAEKIQVRVNGSIGTNEAQDDRDFALKDVQTQVGVNGTLSKFDYTASFGYQKTDGLSAAIDPTGDETDPFKRLNGSLKLGYKPLENLAFSLYGNYDTYDSDYDNSYPVSDAPFFSESTQQRVGLSSQLSYEKGSVTLNTALNSIERSFESDYPTDYDSDSFILDIYNKYVFAEKWHTILGLNVVSGKTQFAESVSTTTTDPYANVVYVSDFGVQLNAGARLNNHSTYGTHFTYSLNPSYTLKQEEGYLKVFGSLATSYIAPSLYQLYGDYGANPDLNPETDRTLEAGMEWKRQSFRVSGTYFNRLEEDFIDYVTINFDTYEGEYQNVSDDFTVAGFETELDLDITSKAHLNANYTFTEQQDKLSLRLPKHRVNATLGYDISKNTYFSVSHQFTGSRNDTDYSTYQQVKLDSFHLVDCFLSYKLTGKQITFFAGMSNIFNADYLELVGYTTKGRNARIGINMTL